MATADTAQLQSRDEEGRTPLLRACQLGKIEIVAWLIVDCGADIFAIDSMNRSPLVCAVASGNVDLVCLLLIHLDGIPRVFVKACDGVILGSVPSSPRNCD